MADLPINFPTDRERLLRLADANWHLTIEQRLLAMDEMRSTAEALRISDGTQVEYDRLRQIRSEEVRSIFRELNRRYIEEHGDCEHALD